MEIEFDEAKRQATLIGRGLDFAEAGRVFDGREITAVDDRRDYGEPRFSTVGRLGRDIVMVVWTPRWGRRRIISMRKCNVQERADYLGELGASG